MPCTSRARAMHLLASPRTPTARSSEVPIQAGPHRPLALHECQGQCGRAFNRVSGPANRSRGVTMASRITEHTAARLRAELAAQHPSIPAHTWHPVLGRNPQALHPEPDSGHVWIDV